MDQAEQHIEQRAVKRRRVFYIPGYDPIHPRRYRELYRTESAEQSSISGYEIGLAPRKGEHYGWRVESRMAGQSVDAEIEVLVWSDIVRNSMSSSIPATYMQLVRTAAIYIGSGALRRLMWLRKGPVIAALYPVGMLLLQLLVAVLLGLLAARLTGWSMTLTGGFLISLLGDPADFDLSFVEAGRTVAQVVVGVLIVRAILKWFKKKDGKFFAYYLMHDYSYSAATKGANPPELEDRMADFRGAIADALDDDVDEVLVVGHSSGAHLAVSILADLFRASLLEPTELYKIADEWKLCQHYLRIEGHRLGERLNVEWDIGSLPDNALVPPLSLQPLLENSIYHGIERLSEGGTINIRGKFEDEKLIIIFSNPIPDKDVEDTHKGNKHAQDNIRQRLDANIGAESDLIIESKQQQYTVKLTLPYKRNENINR